MARTKTDATPTVKVLFPSTAALAVDLDGFLAERPQVEVDVRNARFGMSYVITASRKDAEALLERTVPRAKPDGKMGQPSSWGHGARKAVARLQKALAKSAK